MGVNSEHVSRKRTMSQERRTEQSMSQNHVTYKPRRGDRVSKRTGVRDEGKG